MRHLRELLEMIGVEVGGEPVAVSGAFQAFDAEGRLTWPDDLPAVSSLADAVAGTAEAALAA